MGRRASHAALASSLVGLGCRLFDRSAWPHLRVSWEHDPVCTLRRFTLWNVEADRGTAGHLLLPRGRRLCMKGPRRSAWIS